MPLVSQNELGGLTEKAWRGLSISHPVPWGLAKDSNMMVQWLASRKLSFADSLIECLAMVKANPELAQDNPLESGVLLAPLYGLVMIDSILAEDMAWDGQIYGVNFVIAGMGLLGSDQMADRHDSSQILTLSHTGNLMAECSDQMIRMNTSPLTDSRYALLGSDHMATDQKEDAIASLTPLAVPTADAVNIDDGVWQQMLDYAQNSYVPENELSRHRGAGAGNIDND